MHASPHEFLTYSLRTAHRGDDICRILAASVNGADPDILVKKQLARDGNFLIAHDMVFNLSEINRVYMIGFGKASQPMSQAVIDVLGDVITPGLVITKAIGRYHAFPWGETNIQVLLAGHPIPDQRNLDAAEILLRMTNNLNKEDLVILLISGGGSALLTKPVTDISLPDLQDTTQLLLNCGASIDEINIVRKHLDVFKGGGLAKHLHPASVITLVLSDVIGDKLDVIASGPTVADPSTFHDTWSVVTKYQLENKIPSTVARTISGGMSGNTNETLKPGDPIFTRVRNIFIGNNRLALDSAEKEAMASGFFVERLPETLQGEASETGRNLVNRAKKMLAGGNLSGKPACFIAGGETTVTVRGNGSGGRNQELVLGAVKSLSGHEPLILISLATDGEDGPTDAAGAVGTNNSYARGMEFGLEPDQYLARNDSYNYFKTIGDLLITGPTLTNVNDLVFLFAL